MLGVFMLVFFVTSIAVESASAQTPLTTGSQESLFVGAGIAASHARSSITNDSSNISDIQKKIDKNIDDTFKNFS